MLSSVRDVGGKDDEEKSKEVWWRGKSLGCEASEAHFGEDGREEDGERAKRDVAGEVHESCEVVLYSALVGVDEEYKFRHVIPLRPTMQLQYL